MGIGLGIFPTAVGAIVAFAVHVTVAGLDIRVVGEILMAAGFHSLAPTLLVFAPRRHSTMVETHAVSSGHAPGTNAVPTNVVLRQTATTSCKRTRPITSAVTAADRTSLRRALGGADLCWQRRACVHPRCQPGPLQISCTLEVSARKRI